MPITTKATLTINKLKAKPIDCVYIKLEQFIADHARVEMKLDLETIGVDVLSDPLPRTALINELFQICVQTIGENKKIVDVYDFLGLITDVQVELDAGQHGWMYIYGSSRSIELERGKMLRTHSDKKLNEIVDRVTEDKVYVQIANDPVYKEPIKFSMQYYETDYQYIKRIAWMYGEKLLFNGNKLIFGNIDDKEPIQLEYHKDLIEVKINSKLIANKFKQYYHNLKEEKVPSNFSIDSTSTFTETAHAQSKKLNEKEHQPDVPIATPVYNDGDLKLFTERRTKTVMNQMFSVTGRTNYYTISIGELLTIDFGKKMIVNDSLGNLRITRVLHHFFEKDKYYNEFEACQQAHDYFPYYDIQMPVAQPLTATVKNNQDPDKLGKVQLKFDFENEQCLHWFRSSTPDGGGNKHIGKEKNRGMIFVQELEDRVYVDFMEGNPDKPFVAGSFFHGNNATNLGGGKGNHIRSISDKANNYIQWNSAGGITIKDQAGSTVFLDGAGNINMSCPLTFTLNVGAGDKEHQNQRDGKNYASYRGSSIEMDKMGVIKITGSNITIEATQANPNPEHVTLSENVELGLQITDNSTGLPVPHGSVNIRGKMNVDVDADSQIDVHTKGTMNVHGDFKTEITAGGDGVWPIAKIREECGKVHIN